VTKTLGKLLGGNVADTQGCRVSGGVKDLGLLGITVEGRLFLQKLRAEEKASRG
jgi:hypothetical protein